jgi:hypothetical protein
MGSNPVIPDLLKTSFTTVVIAFFVGIVRAIATNVFSKVKEMMSMPTIFTIALLGVNGNLPEGRAVVVAPSRAPPQ